MYLCGLFLTTLSCNQKPDYSDAEPFYGALVYNDSLYHPTPQFPLSRIFEEVASEERYRFTHPLGHQIDEADSMLVMDMPMQAVVDNDERFVYIMDNESYLINKFSLSDGSLLQSITTAQERRKTPSRQPRLQLLADGSLQVCGTEGRRTLLLHPEGQLKKSFKLPRGIYGCVAGIDADNYVALTSFNFDELFQVLNRRGRIKNSFGMLSNMHTRTLEGDVKHEGGHGLDFVGTIGTDGIHFFCLCCFKLGRITRPQY